MNNVPEEIDATKIIEIDSEKRQEWMTTRQSTIDSLNEVLRNLKYNFKVSNYTRLSGASAGLTGVGLMASSRLFGYLAVGLFTPGFLAMSIGACISIAATVREALMDRRLIAQARQLVDVDIDKTSELHDLISFVVSTVEVSRDIANTVGIHGNTAIAGLLTRVKKQALGHAAGGIFIAIGAVVDLLELIEAGKNLSQGSPIVTQFEGIIEQLQEEMELVKKHSKPV